MTLPENLTVLNRDDLLALVAALQRQIAELTARNEALQAEIEQLRRGAKRQAAPFSKGRASLTRSDLGGNPALASSVTARLPCPRRSPNHRWMSQ